jgi:hypothetical protein
MLIPRSFGHISVFMSIARKLDFTVRQRAFNELSEAEIQKFWSRRLEKVMTVRHAVYPGKRVV